MPCYSLLAVESTSNRVCTLSGWRRQEQCAPAPFSELFLESKTWVPEVCGEVFWEFLSKHQSGFCTSKQRVANVNRHVLEVDWKAGKGKAVTPVEWSTPDKKVTTKWVCQILAWDLSPQDTPLIQNRVLRRRFTQSSQVPVTNSISWPWGTTLTYWTQNVPRKRIHGEGAQEPVS